MLKRLVYCLSIIAFSGGTYAQDSTTTCEELGFPDTPCACQFLKENLIFDENGARLQETSITKRQGGERWFTANYLCPGEDRPTYLRAYLQKNAATGKKECAIGRSASCVDTGGPKYFIDLKGKTVQEEKRALTDTLVIIDDF